MSLDARGYISIVVIIIYIPILLAGIILSLRHGFARKDGWVTLVLLSIVREAGAVTRILSENDPTNTTYPTIYGVLETAGMSPLLVATLGFLRMTAQYGLDQRPMMATGHKLVTIVAGLALFLAVFGGTKVGNAKSQSDLDTGNTLRHASSVVFALVYAAIVFLTVYCWQNKQMIMKYRRKLLLAITITLPFLAIRVLYGILGSFASATIAIRDGHAVPIAPGDSGLSKFSPQSSSWGLYLVMLVMAEYITVLTYAVIGIVTPLKKDTEEYERNNTGTRSGAHCDSGRLFNPWFQN
ncbi:hypothetical protein OH77DRAFT_1493955 [Trametes cingulata]|nr:hypothetical protein OH77DRAFT_1493955 [Trametes cingulata]